MPTAGGEWLCLCGRSKAMDRAGTRGPLTLLCTMYLRMHSHACDHAVALAPSSSPRRRRVRRRRGLRFAKPDGPPRHCAFPILALPIETFATPHTPLAMGATRPHEGGAKSSAKSKDTNKKKGFAIGPANLPDGTHRRKSKCLSFTSLCSC